MARVSIDTILAAPRDVVYRLFAERDSLNSYLPIDFTLKKPGTPEPNGVGAQYLVGVGGKGITEETTLLVPDERVEYKIVAGAPVKRHVGIITLADAPGGTLVTYTMESEPKLPLPGPVGALVLRGLIAPLLRGARKAVTAR